jgi:hypothetical protein
LSHHRICGKPSGSGYHPAGTPKPLSSFTL